MWLIFAYCNLNLFLLFYLVAGKQVKAHELRTKTKPEMLKQLGELKKELSEV